MRWSAGYRGRRFDETSFRRRMFFWRADVLVRFSARKRRARTPPLQLILELLNLVQHDRLLAPRLSR